MVNKQLFFAVVVAVLATALYFLGLFDVPPFAATSSPDLIAIVALSDSKDIGGNIMRLMSGTLEGIRATSSEGDDHRSALRSAASRYGSPLGAEYLSVGLYLDNPKVVQNPRWSIGYAIDASFEQAQQIASKMAPVAGTHVVRAVRIPMTKTLSARIPWRCMFSPMIAPHLHWSRGVSMYKKEGHSSKCGRHTDSFGDQTNHLNVACVIAAEVYVTGPKGSPAWLDYHLVMGDTTVTLDDLYPAADESHQGDPDAVTPEEKQPVQVEEEVREAVAAVVEEPDVVNVDPVEEETQQEGAADVVSHEDDESVEPDQESATEESVQRDVQAVVSDGETVETPPETEVVSPVVENEQNDQQQHGTQEVRQETPQQEENPDDNELPHEHFGSDEEARAAEEAEHEHEEDSQEHEDEEHLEEDQAMLDEEDDDEEIASC